TVRSARKAPVGCHGPSKPAVTRLISAQSLANGMFASNGGRSRRYGPFLFIGQPGVAESKLNTAPTAVLSFERNRMPYECARFRRISVVMGRWAGVTQLRDLINDT